MGVTVGVHLLVPIKPLHLAKSRLLGATGDGSGRTAAHAELVAAVALDTVEAALRAEGVNGVTVVTSDRRLSHALNTAGVEVVPDTPAIGLNAALRHGAAAVRNRASARQIGALQADLPALRPAELDMALRAADNARAFCPDRHSTGTTLLLAEPGQELDPHFGPDSAGAHLASGAKTLDGPWESLRCDVDTPDDLAVASALGLGRHCLALVDTPHPDRR